jgi:hypothetical protein
MALAGFVDTIGHRRKRDACMVISKGELKRFAILSLRKRCVFAVEAVEHGKGMLHLNAGEGYKEFSQALGRDEQPPHASNILGEDKLN